MLSKLEKLNHRLSGWFEWIGMAALLAIMVVTLIDVVGAKLFAWRLLGAIDIVQISQAVGIAFAGAMLLILDRHVHVTFLFDRLPRRAQTVIEIIIHFLELGLFILIVWPFLSSVTTCKRGVREPRPSAYPFILSATGWPLPLSRSVL